MAHQVGGGRPSTKPARGNAPNTGMPVTPAPTEDALLKLTKAKDVSWGRQQYGGNGYGGPVSTRPGETVMSDLAKSLKAKNAEGDAGDLLQDIIDGSNRRNDDLISSQLRKVDDTLYPVSSNMRRQQADYSDIGRPKLPASTDRDDQPSPAETVQKPGTTRS